MNVSVLEHLPETETRFSSAGSALRLRGVTKAFGAHEVLHGSALDIQAGQFVAIVGRSGCGKSTLLRLLAGLDTATAGSVEFDGAPVSAARGDARIMFQEARLLPWKSVLDNVALGLPKAERGRAAEALQQVGL